MVWLSLAFLSALLLGFYDTCKKKSLDGNAVIPVLFLNTLFSSVIFLPFIPNRSLEKVSCHFLMTAIRKIALYMLDS